MKIGMLFHVTKVDRNHHLQVFFTFQYTSNSVFLSHLLFRHSFLIENIFRKILRCFFVHRSQHFSLLTSRDVKSSHEMLVVIKSIIEMKYNNLQTREEIKSVSENAIASLCVKIDVNTTFFTERTERYLLQ